MPPQESIYEFQMIPQYQRYYNEDTNYGVYDFNSKDNLPESVEYKDTLNEYYNEDLKQSTLVGRI
jgi:hypothetical protein